MAKSVHRKNHKRKVQNYRKMLQENKRLEVKRRKELIEQMQQEYIRQQQEEIQASAPKDEELLNDLDEFKLDD